MERGEERAKGESNRSQTGSFTWNESLFLLPHSLISFLHSYFFYFKPHQKRDWNNNNNSFHWMKDMNQILVCPLTKDSGNLKILEHLWFAFLSVRTAIFEVKSWFGLWNFSSHQQREDWTFCSYTLRCNIEYSEQKRSKWSLFPRLFAHHNGLNFVCPHLSVTIKRIENREEG